MTRILARFSVLAVLIVILCGCTPQVLILVPDMMCEEGCATKVREILFEQPGAKAIVVDFDSKTATVSFEDGKFDAEAAVAALVDHGFEHSTLKSDANPSIAADPPLEQPAD